MISGGGNVGSSVVLEPTHPVGSLYLLKLTNEVRYSPEAFSDFRRLVGESENLYPGIEGWFNQKVIPGIESGERYAYVMFMDGRPIAEAIVKTGGDTKICSMRIVPQYQKLGLGPLLFEQIAHALPNETRFVHFTAPESLVVERHDLFKTLGFDQVGIAKVKYRTGEDEFVYRAPAKKFIAHTQALVSELSQNKTRSSDTIRSIVMSIHPKWVDLIMRKRKTVEIRKSFSEENVGATMFIYATRPRKAVMGEANVKFVCKGSPDEIWYLFGDQVGCTKEEYQAYCGDSSKISAILLENICSYERPLTWATFATAFDAPPNPPQSFQYLRPSGFIPRSVVPEVYSIDLDV